MLRITIAITVSYLLGAIPTAYLFGRMLKGIDIRTCGSGNVGATNALRVLGKGPGICVLLLDILKGTIAVALAGAWATEVPHAHLSRELILVLAGVVCIAGHNWTVFLNFKGGKGVATTLGVLIGLGILLHGLLWVLLLCVATWLVSFLATRIVSVGSLAAAVSLPIYMFLFKQSALLCSASILLSLFVILRHKANVLRLLKGEEKRISFRKK